MQFNTTPDTRTNAQPLSTISVNAAVRNAQRLHNTVNHVADAFFASLSMREVTKLGIVANDDGFTVEFRNPYTYEDGKLNVPTKWLSEPPFDVEWPEAPVAEMVVPIEVAE